MKMKSFISMLLCSLLFLCMSVPTRTHASPGTGTLVMNAHAYDGLTYTVSDQPAVMAIYPTTWGTAIASENKNIQPVFYWTTHITKIDGGFKASYYYLMGQARYAIMYSKRN